MYKFICVLAFVGAAYAASIGAGVESTTEKREIIPLLRYETDRKPDGSFSFSYEGGDQSARDEAGVVENVGTEEETLEVHGSYRYIDADGQEIEVHYTAGKNGFVPIGTNIPAEISEAAKAAADQPNEPVETEKVKRSAHSNKEGKEEEGEEKEKESKGGKQDNEKESKEEKEGQKEKEGKEEQEVKGKKEEQEKPEQTAKVEKEEKPEKEEKEGKAEEDKKKAKRKK
ncbi:larval cuticle protein LCP-17-like [Bactrocera neohumeralis]|uniref:larval cuticle protein LCP-17-like n=1 Tax=Bactrocera neohumeralis TaxID=98809 RepID=UPI00216527D2|nr:larval cuticle protein LCP-17-like [Bactrocera neohumeralis]